MDRPALTDLALDAFETELAAPGLRPFHARSVRTWVFRRGVAAFSAMTDLPREARDDLERSWRVRRGTLLRTERSADGTLGLLTRLDDGRVIESVRIPEGRRQTLCISSQVGCAVGCVFCASGLEGVERNLTSGEIVEQVLVAREAVPGRALTNYVFMGSGEPTHNLKAVVRALEVMTHPEGLGIGARRITVSTVGHAAALARLAEVDIPFNVALSLHASDDVSREALMPGLGRSHLAATLAAARERFDRTGRRLTVEMVLMADRNDTEEDAHALARLLAGFPAAVNLIPWNPVEGMDLATPSERRVRHFARCLREAGVNVTVRRPRGRDVGVACGQLRRRA